MDGAGLLVGLGRAAPNHDQAVALVLGAEPLNVGDEGLGLVPLGGLGLDPGSLQFFDPALVENGVHGDDALQLGRHRGEVPFFQHTAGAGRFQHVGRDRVPAAEDQVVQAGQGNELPYKRVAVLVAVAEADMGHLADRADRGGEAIAGSDHAGDEGGGHGAHSGGEDSEASGGGGDVEGGVHGPQDKQIRNKDE